MLVLQGSVLIFQLNIHDQNQGKRIFSYSVRISREAAARDVFLYGFVCISWCRWGQPLRGEQGCLLPAHPMENEKLRSWATTRQHFFFRPRLYRNPRNPTGGEWGGSMLPPRPSCISDFEVKILLRRRRNFSLCGAVWVWGGGRRPPPGFPEHISVLQTFGLSPWNSMKRWGSSYLLSLPWKACGEKAVVGGGAVFSLPGV